MCAEAIRLVNICISKKICTKIFFYQGACKVLSVGKENNVIYLKDFHSPPPEGFAFKTSVEINLLKNKHSFENNLPVEGKRPIGYNLDNAAVVTIRHGSHRRGFSVRKSV